MKKMINKSAALIICLLMFLEISGCGGASSGGNEYVFETDNQYNLPYTYATAFAQADTGLYVLRDCFLYYIEDGKTVVPLCTKADCMHTFGSDECSAWMGFARNLFYYNGYLYIISETESYTENVTYDLKKYTLKGEYVKTLATLPGSLQNVIQHRGKLYYSYYAEVADANEDVMGIPTYACVSLQGGKEQILYQSEDYTAYLGNFKAYGEQVYALESIINAENLTADTRIMIYNIESKQMSSLDDVGEVYPYDGGLLFYKNDGAERELYLSPLDGTDVQPMSLKLEYEAGLCCAFDDYLIEENIMDYTNDSIEDGTYQQQFVVYKDGQLLTRFMLSDVDGTDYSGGKCSLFQVTDEAIYVLGKSGHSVDLIYIDRSALEQGSLKTERICTWG